MNLVAKAADAMKNAYAPYSKFHVGCALLTDSGKVFTGCNMENASYGATICAERVAIGQMVASGERKIRELAIISSGERPVVPCGMCLQVILEFGADCEVNVSSRDQKTTKKFKLRELIPQSFDKSFLNEKG